MLSADCRPWNSARRVPSSGRIGRIDAVEPSARTTVVSHSAGYPSGVGAAIAPACPSTDADGWPATPAEAAENILVLLTALNDHDRLTRGHSNRLRLRSPTVLEVGAGMSLEYDQTRVLTAY